MSLEQNKSLHKTIQKQTQTLHDRIEQTYPFSHLLDPTHLEQTVDDFLTCFKWLFTDFLKKESHEFFKNCLNVLEAHTPRHDLSLYEKPSLNQTALKYVFLGSRMGNEVIKKKNPEVLNQSDFFKFNVPKDLWRDFLQTQLGKAYTPADHDEILKDCEKAFQALIEMGTVLEKFNKN